jgi:hypothetical protein
VIGFFMVISTIKVSLTRDGPICKRYEKNGQTLSAWDPHFVRSSIAQRLSASKIGTVIPPVKILTV